MPSDVPFEHDKLRGGGRLTNTKGDDVDIRTAHLGRLTGGINPNMPKYNVTKSDPDAFVAQEAEYFVFNVTTDPDARASLLDYANRVRSVNPLLADDIVALVGRYE